MAGCGRLGEVIEAHTAKTSTNREIVTMGEYYKWVNVTKREYISPNDFNRGNKIHESTLVGNAFLGALYELLATEWRGDEIVFLGDETHIGDHEDNRTLKKLHDARKRWDEDETEWDYVYEYFKNISGVFKAAEKNVQEELEYILSAFAHGVDVFNPYRVDLKKPYNGLFVREGQHFRFTINETKHEYYALSRLPIKTYERDGKTITYQSDPLPILCAYGHSAIETFAGRWIGDTITPTDEKPPSDFTDVGLIYRW